MLYGYGINTLMAFAMAVTFIFTCGDVDDLLAAQTVQPYIAVFLRSTRSETAAVAMVVPVILCLFTALVSEIATGSRQNWSLARDGGLPLANHLKLVSQIHSANSQNIPKTH
jgi:choline transport protein